MWSRKRLEARIERLHRAVQREKVRAARASAPYVPPSPEDQERVAMKYLGQVRHKNRDFWKAPVRGLRWIVVGTGRGRWIILNCKSGDRHKNWRLFVPREYPFNVGNWSPPDPLVDSIHHNTLVVGCIFSDLGLSTQRIFTRGWGDIDRADYQGRLLDGYPKLFGRLVYRSLKRFDDRGGRYEIVRVGVPSDLAFFDSAKAIWDDEHRCRRCGRPGVRTKCCRQGHCWDEVRIAHEAEQRRRQELRKWRECRTLLVAARKALRCEA